jgi:hypothetical protein
MLEELLTDAAGRAALEGAAALPAPVLETGPEARAMHFDYRREDMDDRSRIPCSVRWPHRSGQEAVVGSIILLIGVILLAGKPESSACLRINSSSFAR